jgi:hypothetical protein
MTSGFETGGFDDSPERYKYGREANPDIDTLGRALFDGVDMLSRLPIDEVPGTEESPLAKRPEPRTETLLITRSNDCFVFYRKTSTPDSIEIIQQPRLVNGILQPAREIVLGLDKPEGGQQSYSSIGAPEGQAPVTAPELSDMFYKLRGATIISPEDFEAATLHNIGVKLTKQQLQATNAAIVRARQLQNPEIFPAVTTGTNEATVQDKAKRRQRIIKGAGALVLVIGVGVAGIFMRAKEGADANNTSVPVAAEPNNYDAPSQPPILPQMPAAEQANNQASQAELADQTEQHAERDAIPHNANIILNHLAAHPDAADLSSDEDPFNASYAYIDHSPNGASGYVGVNPQSDNLEIGLHVDGNQPDKGYVIYQIHLAADNPILAKARQAQLTKAEIFAVLQHQTAPTDATVDFKTPSYSGTLKTAPDALPSLIISKAANNDTGTADIVADLTTATRDLLNRATAK